jgi:hypothetical protein
MSETQPTRGASAARRLAVVAILVAYALSPALAEANRSPGTTSLRPRQPTFTITGRARRLSPGVTRILRLRVRDPAPFAILVREVTVTVHDANPACSHRHVRVTSYAGSLRVPARGSSLLRLAITLLPSAPDACQGARFPLGFHGRAERG